MELFKCFFVYTKRMNEVVQTKKSVFENQLGYMTLNERIVLFNAQAKK